MVDEGILPRPNMISGSDARLSEIVHALTRCVPELVRRSIGTIAPDRSLNAMRLPHIPVCESDLSTCDTFATGLEGVPEQAGYAIGVCNG
jgi:hypothetical protein